MKRLYFFSFILSIALSINAQSKYYVNKAAAGNESGDSWDNAFVDLEDALAVACKNDTVWVAKGTYKPNDHNPSDLERQQYFQINSDLVLLGGFNGDETNCKQRDLTSNKTILSGEIGDENLLTDNITRLIDCGNNEEEATVLIDGFVFSDMYGDKYNVYGITGYQGAGIAIGGVLNFELVNCTFENNYGKNHGAGVLILPNAEVLIRNCAFKNNRGDGVGTSIYNYSNNLTIKSCTFDSDSSSRWGGSVYCGRNTVIDSCSFVNNASSQGGGAIYVNSGSLDLRNSTFTNNRCYSYEGGAISLRSDAVSNIVNCIFNNNSGFGVVTKGGAIGCDRALPTIVGCLFDGNFANYGSAVYGYSTAAKIIGSTIVNNTGGNAVHFYIDPDATMINSVLWNNSNNIYAMDISVHDCAVQGGYANGTNITNLSSTNTDPTGPNFNNPLTADYTLNSNSPLIDIGVTNNSYTTKDIGNNPRLVGVDCDNLKYDMGSYEYYSSGLSYNASATAEISDFKVFLNSEVILDADQFSTAAQTITWYKNGASAGTGVNYVINNFAEEDAGNYYYTASTGCETTTSTSGDITFYKDITIESQTGDVLLNKGEDTVLVFEAMGEDLNFVWYFNDVKLCDERDSILKISDASCEEQGVYSCMAYSIGGTLKESEAIEVKVQQTSTFNFEICEGDSVNINDIYYKESTMLEETFQDVDGCDSIVNYILVVNPTYLVNQQQSICSSDSVYLEGAYRKTQGVYYDTLSTITGCDSIIMTVLIVNPVYLMNEQLTICSGDSVFLGGAFRKYEGVYYDTLSTITGCDSIIATELEVNPAYLVNEQQTICSGDSVFLENAYQKTAGIFYDTLKSLSGCDSIIVTELMVNASFNVDQQQSICSDDSIYLEGAYQKYAGIYIDTLQTSFGCDSIISTQLEVNPTYELQVDTTILEGESYYAQGDFQTVPGIYRDTLQTELGCDSIVITNLDVINFSLIHNAFTGSIKIYPNPVNDELSVKTNEGVIGELVLYDIVGNMIEHKQYTVSEIKLNVSHLENGFYILVINTTNGIKTVRIAKE